MNTSAAVIAGAAPVGMSLGQYAVVMLGINGEAWSTGRTYATARSAFGVATRNLTDSANAYVIKRHRAGTTVYLSPDTVLGTVAA